MSIAVLLIVGLVVSLYFVVLPIYARHRLNQMLLGIGVADPQYVLRRVTLRGIEVAEVRLGKRPWLTAERIRVRYDPFDLLSGWLGTVEIIGATFTVGVRDGAVDWGVRPSSKRGEYRDPFTFGQIRLQDCRFAMEVNGQTIDASINGTCTASAGNALKTDVAVEALGQSLQVTSLITTGPDTTQARVDVAPFTVTRLDDLADILPPLKGMEVGGRCALSADVRFNDGRIEPLITLEIADAMIAHRDWPLAIASANAALVFDSLTPLRTRGQQRIDIAAATTGELDIRDGAILFTLESPNALMIDDVQWTFADGGKFRAQPFTLNPTEPRIVTSVACHNLDLNFWLKLIAQDRADGEGRLHGKFAVDWDPNAYPRLQFTGGMLVADPASGFIRTHDAQRLGELIDQSDGRFSVDATLRVVKQQIIDALEDFAFTSLELEFIPDGRDTTLRAQLKGKGRRGPRPQEFGGLVVNVGHFAETLQSVLSAKSAIDRVQEVTGRALQGE